MAKLYQALQSSDRPNLISDWWTSEFEQLILLKFNDLAFKKIKRLKKTA